MIDFLDDLDAFVAELEASGDARPIVRMQSAIETKDGWARGYVTATEYIEGRGTRELCVVTLRTRVTLEIEECRGDLEFLEDSMKREFENRAFVIKKGRYVER